MTAKQTAKRIGVSALLALALLGGLAGLWLIASEPALAQARARVLIEIDDSDSVVSPGDDLDVHIWVRYGLDTPADLYSLRYFHAVNGPTVIDPATKRSVAPEEPDLTGALVYVASVRLTVPLGSADSKATLSALIDVKDSDPLELGTAILTVGDGGDPVGSAKISSAIEKFAETGTRSSTSQRSAGTVFLKLEALNGRGKLTNDYDIKSIFISATGGLLSANGSTATYEHFMEFTDDPSDDAPDANALTEFTISSLGRKPIHIDVDAIVIGEDGSARSNTLAVNFAGQASRIEALDPRGTLPAADGEVRLVVKGFDSADTADDITSRDITAKVIAWPKDADPNGVRAMTPFRSCATSDTDCELGDVIVRVVTGDEPADLGTYTVEVTLTDTAVAYTTTASVVVVGEPVFLLMELYGANATFAHTVFGGETSGLLLYQPGQGESEQLIVAEVETVYAAAVLLDRFGQRIYNTDSHVSDDGVTFQALGSLEATQFDRGERELVRGLAYSRFLFVGGEGRALIVATSGDLEEHVVVVRESEAQFGLKGLISTEADDYSTWIAANTVRISEIYGLLQARGITAVHLWLSGEKRWLSYAVVEDAAVPGSVDFLITYGDTLWLSG